MVASLSVPVAAAAPSMVPITVDSPIDIPPINAKP